MHKSFTTTAATAARIYLYSARAFEALETDPFAGARAIAAAQAFTGAAGQTVLVPGADGRTESVLFGLGNGRDALAVAALAGKLPEGDYEIVDDGGQPFAHIAAAWADGAYRFERYKTEKSGPPRLKVPGGMEGERLGREADAAAHLRDMVNTPASDMTPAGLQAEMSALAEKFGATFKAMVGDALLAGNFPMVHAVGRAATEAPRFLELEWGKPGDPKVALVGKGITFDSGGLNIKAGDGMRIMKKDMGGAAHAIALAGLVMGAGLPVHLKLYVSAAENAISGNSFRPGDILSSRKGLTVEIDNTDAEGRLVLGDALARASEDDPDLLMDFATLTGAARVALGADLAPLYTDDETLAADVLAASARTGDPVWRMPLWDPYLADLKSPVADLVNSGGSFGGSITAAVFLKQFVAAKSWAHFDIWAWRKAKYGRPEGGAPCGLRAVWSMLEARYGA
ncbi:MAG: leucyl aminopeptidase family protein [Hyphomonas sp.]|uniref:leucyl aminopeptidase family protein n=1 Tax=Hyphomonas sp. TaxID=87 RepID=UPI0018173647|nr:leucyl aminopeptidase family protein [Hyphomonas sp.]MBA3069389.1 leucyl aminopeptidase family protein [Hyphomonas sp.]MBU4063771.1 leucyl aminopeptidase family protein [Alphaproteobacteria bacterium]MBU4164268.1 leucyl aminopeptidase family protein [Alphaproteobacteria bacterium]MBU4568373.1 leucyl aminopeptidase family protein [Alphaproteobacteria bacterium]